MHCYADISRQRDELSLFEIEEGKELPFSDGEVIGYRDRELGYERVIGAGHSGHRIQ